MHHSDPTVSEAGTDARPGVARGFGVDRAFELLAVFTIAVSLVGQATTLAGVFHTPQVLLAGLVLGGWYGYRTRDRGAALGATRPRWMHLALLIAVALFFRLPAYHYVLGGQDEGLYTNIAQQIEHTGGAAIQDEVLPKLTADSDRQTYLHDNYFPHGFLPGVYANDNRIVFQFYHLFPVWMALFAGLFGATGGAYALTFFALLSVLFFYRLTLLLTRSHAAALTAGGLLALNPLHAFFSKFAVTEVPTMAFSLLGFTLLGAYWSSPELRRRDWLALSVLAFLCLFLTRISGFMYMPFFAALAFAALAFDGDAARRGAVQRWAIAAMVAYAASLFYGWRVSPYYAADIYRTSLAPLMGAHWPALLILIVVVGCVVWIALAAWTHAPRRRERLAERIVRTLAWLPTVVVLAALLIGLFKIYELAFTLHYAHDPWLGDYWHLAGGGWQSVAASSLWTLVVYVGPLLALALLLVLLRRQNDPRVEFLRWFVAGFFAYIAVLQWTVPYGPYYARYLLSELVPYGILLVVCGWSALRVGTARAAFTAVLFLSLIYAGLVSAAQIGKSENDGAYTALARLVAPTDSGDLILLNAPPMNFIKLPLMFTFNRQVVTVDSDALHNPTYLAHLGAIYGDMFLISPEAIASPGFSMLDAVHNKVVSYEQSHEFPRRLVPTEDETLYLYRWNGSHVSPGSLHLALASTQALSIGSPWLVWLHAGWGAPEGWGVWNDGKQAFLAINPRQLPNLRGLSLVFDARVFVSSANRQQRIDISVDGVHAAHYAVEYPDTGVTLQVPIPNTLLSGSSAIIIGFDLPDAVTPQALGQGQDARQLAIGLQDVTATAATTLQAPESGPATNAAASGAASLPPGSTPAPAASTHL